MLRSVQQTASLPREREPVAGAEEPDAKETVYAGWR